MADESFILTLVGQLDENGTKQNVESTLKKLNAEINKSNLGTLKVFDKDELERQGNIYISGVEDIKKRISELFNTENFSIANIFDDKGAIEKFKVSITDTLNVLKEFNFERTKFTDGTSGFVLNSGTNVGNTNGIVSGFNNVSTSVNSAKNNVKVFTNESINELNNLSNKVSQTANSFTNVQDSVKSIQNILNGANFYEVGDFTFRGFNQLEDFLNLYQKFAGEFKGNPTLNLNVDDNGKLQGFTARLETAEGATKNLYFRLQKLDDVGNEFFRYFGANVNDNTFTRQVEDITKLEEQYTKFKNKLQDGVSFKFIDTQDTIDKLKSIESIILNLKNNMGNNNIGDIESTQKLLSLIIDTANETEKVEKKRQAETDKTTQKLEKQATQLDKNRVLIKSWLNTKVNPDSASFVGNSDKLDEVVSKLQEVIRIRAELSQRNKAREILSEKDIGRLTVAITELRQLFTEARRESGQAIDRNESYAKLAQDINVATSALDANIAKWKNMGVYTGEFKANVESLRNELTATDETTGKFVISSSKELDIAKAKMKEYSNEALEIQRTKFGSNAKDIESQRKYIELATESLKRYKKEVTDSNSMNPLKGEDLQKAINAIDYVEARLTALKNRNTKGEIVDVQLINQLEIELAKLKNEIDGYYDSQRKLKLSDDVIKSVDLYREKLVTLEQRYSEMIQKSDSFKQSFESVKNSLANVKTPEELQAWEQSFKKMQEAAKQTGMTMRNELRTEELSQKVTLLRQQIEAYMQANSRAASIYANSFKQLQDALDNVANNGDLRKIQNEFKSLKLTVKQAGVEGKTFGQRMQDAFKRISSYAGITSMMMYTVRAIREIINNVKELDSSMVSLKKVTDETDGTYNAMFKNAIKNAKELKISVTDIIDSTAEFSKLGFDVSQAEELSKIASVYSNVGELNIEDATSSIVSTVKAFHEYTNEVEAATHATDMFNAIGNTEAVSSADLGEILKRSSSAMAAVGSTMDEVAALGTAGNTIVQDSAAIGTSLKTLAMRLTSTKIELEEMGEDTEYAATCLSDYRKQVLALTANKSKQVDILNVDGTYKRPYEMMKELSEVFDEMTNMEKSALGKLLFGVRQANVGMAILDNFEIAERALATAEDSAGSAMEEHAKWSKSIEASFQNVEATFQSISANILNSESFKSIMDTLNNILDIVEGITKAGSGAIPVFTSLSALMGSMGNGIYSYGSVSESKTLIKEYNESLTKSATAQTEFLNSISKTNPKFYEYATNLNGASANMKDYKESLIAAGLETVGLRIKTIALNVAINSLIGLGIGALITGITKLINHQKELTKEFEESTGSIKNSLNTIDEYKERIDSIISSESDEASKLEQLGKVKDEISDKYRTEIDDINSVTEAREKLVKAIDSENEAELRDYYRKNRKFFNQTQTEFNESMDNGVTRAGWFGANNVGALNNSMSTSRFLNFNDEAQNKIGEDITKLFDSFTREDAKLGYTLDFNIDAKDPLEYYDKLKEAINSIDDVRSKSQDGLTEAEEAVYNLATSRLEQLDKWLYGEDNLAESMLESAKAFADYYTMMNPQGNKSVEEWKEYLLSIPEVANSPLIQNAISNLINNMESVNEVAEESINPLSEVISNLSSIGQTCSEISTAIDEADEKFSKLSSTIEDNKDADKFFSASDIIELLDLYPELSDAIIETQYGYKIEEDALESLKEAKLTEKKVALESQLYEAKVLQDSVKEKLDSYSSELGGIKTVSEAKAKAAELELELARVKQENSTDPYKVQASYLEEQIGLLNDFASAQEDYEKYNQTLKQLQAEINVLGKYFDNVKDSTKDETEALNEQKNTIKDLNDAMKDAQDDINDLIELTMAMLKKEAELQKEALKERLDEYKSLIDKQKELIDLEKEEADFKSDLAEKDKNYLKVQQELDALSIEGANYSLEDMKRKEELTEELAEKEKDRTDFLYDHEVDVRKDALDKESDAFEDQINTQIKQIEDYLDKEGVIRQQAIDLINGKSEQFYNDLFNYTMTYTDKSRYEFEKLWNDAYAAIMQYASGQLDVDLALMNILSTLELNEQKLKDIEAQTNSLKNATTGYYDAAIDGATKYKKVLDSIGNAPTINANEVTSWQNVLSANDKFGRWVKDAKAMFSNLPTHHSGGIVGGESSQHGEILAKLLSGEVVVTEGQARNFMENTLPKLTGNVTTNNSSIAPVINMGDINISGNADQTTVNQIKSIQKSIVDDVFKAINSQKNIFNGGRVRTV